MTSSILSTILAAESEGGGGLTGLLIILVPMGAILYMTIMPQRKQRQKQADMLKHLDVGDEVLTNGGVIGQITFIEDDIYHLEVDHDVVIRISKGAVSRNLSAEPEEAERPAAKGRKGLLEGALGGHSKDNDGADSSSIDGKQSRSK